MSILSRFPTPHGAAGANFNKLLARVEGSTGIVQARKRLKNGARLGFTSSRSELKNAKDGVFQQTVRGRIDMHEMALCESVLRIVQEHAQRHGARQVKTVRLEIGSLAGVEPEAMRFGFAAISRGTAAQGAALDFIVVAARGWCSGCCCEREMTSYLADCPVCNAPLAYRGGGDALRVKELDVI